MLDAITAHIQWDADSTPRARRLQLMRRVLDGTLYDALPYEFHEERAGSGEYVPLRMRRPSVRYPLARIVVEDSVALLFSASHFPTVGCAHGPTRDALAAVCLDARWNALLTDAATRGSVGSVAIVMRVLRGRVFFEVMDTDALTPEWDPLAPDVLLRVTERRRVDAAGLRAAGYDVAGDGAQWFQRTWDADGEWWFLPSPQGVQPLLDDLRSVRHGLGFVPVAWVRNLPGGTHPDGACTFRAAVETSIEIDYQLSQAGRGLKYSSDPTLLIKEPAGMEGEVVRGAANALVVSEKGDARLLEINGTAAGAVLQYVRLLRELALEGVHGNRADGNRLAAQSGRAMELMNQGLVWLADRLRVSYGDALLQLCRMVVRASTRFPLQAGGHALAGLDEGAALHLVWPPWYPAGSADRARDADTVLRLLAAGQLSAAAARRVLAADWGADASADAELLKGAKA